MLDQIDLDRKLNDGEYQQRLPALQAKLYAMEQTLLERRIPALIVFEGWAGTSKIGTIGLLTRRLDPRGLRVHPVAAPRTYETMYPWLQRFWLKTPGYGQMAIFDRSWYRQVLGDRTRSDLANEQWRQRCDDMVSFERQLADDGALILKFWLHISQHEQHRRFSKALDSPVTAWQITEEDQWQNRHYKRVRDAAEDLLVRTHAPYAPWIVVPATHKHYMYLTVIETVVKALEARVGSVETIGDDQRDESFDESGLFFRRRQTAANGNGALLGAIQVDQPEPAVEQAAVARGADEAITAPHILQQVDLSLKLNTESYERKLSRLQAKLHLLGLSVYEQKRPVVLVFEGWDAAGKGGAIKRLTEQLDPRVYVVHAIAAPAGEDKDHHYLYRFWRRLPARGTMGIFDRSWYGRVLVERVEGYARPAEWQRAYTEINDFEQQLIEFGTIICKFWLHISPEEQLRRFENRQSVPYKAWKLTDEDWRNREKRPQYELATDEMLLRTSTPAAPWTVVEAESKRFARIKVLRTVADTLEAELGKVKL